MKKIEDCLILIDEIHQLIQELKELNVSDNTLSVLEDDLTKCRNFIEYNIRVNEQDTLHEISIP